MSITFELALAKELQSNMKLKGYKWKKSSCEYVSKASGHVKSLSLDILGTSSSDRVKVSLNGHIKIIEIEEVYAPHNPFLSASQIKSNNTISINCDNFYSNKLLSSSISISLDIGEYSESLWQGLSNDILPILDRYSERTELVSNLRLDNFNDWIISDRIKRGLILLSDDAIENDKELFEKDATELLSHCDGPHFQQYLPIANAVVLGIRKEHF